MELPAEAVWRSTVWSKDADDRAFLHELSYEIVASVATSELDDFNTLVARYFANPDPPMPRRTYGTPLCQPNLTPVVPAVITAVLNMLLMEIQETAQYDQSDIVKRGLKRLFRRRGTHPNERVSICAASKLRPRELDLIVYLYTLPVRIRVPLTRLAEVAYETARLYRLDEACADALVPTVIARMSMGLG
jgi:hypothetical protein